MCGFESWLRFIREDKIEFSQQGNFYSLQEVEDYLDSLPFMDEQLRQSEMKGLKFFPDEPVAA